MTNSLIERLRDPLPEHKDRDGCWHCMQKAADEIERQRKLISELNQHYGGQADEIERLRAALEEIVNHPEATNYESPSYYHGRDELQEIASEALKDDN